MKKIPLALLYLIILAQLGWLSLRFDTLSAELAAAPRIRVPAELQWPYLQPTPTTFPQLDAANPFFGASLRTDPSHPQSPIQLSSGTTLAGFLRAGDDGLWRLTRVETPGSPEDQPADGERRMWVHARQTCAPSPATPYTDTSSPRVWKFYLMDTPGDLYRGMLRHSLSAPDHDITTATLEIALRPHHPPLITAAEID